MAVCISMLSIRIILNAPQEVPYNLWFFNEVAETCRESVIGGLHKKDQFSGIFSPTYDQFRTGNTTDLVFFCPPKNRNRQVSGGFHGGSPVAPSLTNHMLYQI